MGIDCTGCPPVGTRERGVNLCADANEASGHSILQLILLGKERGDLGKDRGASDLALRVLLNDSGADLNLGSLLEHPAQDGASRDTTLEIAHLLSRLIHIERSDDDHAGIRGEVTHGDGDLLGHVLGHNVDVVAKLGRDWDDGGLLGNGALDKGLDVLILLQSSLLLDKVNLVLQKEEKARGRGRGRGDIDSDTDTDPHVFEFFEKCSVLLE